jgi:hypothetical protein
MISINMAVARSRAWGDVWPSLPPLYYCFSPVLWSELPWSESASYGLGFSKSDSINMAVARSRAWGDVWPCLIWKILIHRKRIPTTAILNYSISMVVAPQYATFGPQTFCDRAPGAFTRNPDCSAQKNTTPKNG